MYIITGGSGFLGGHIISNLKDSNKEFFIVRRGDYDLRIENDARRLFERFKGTSNLKVINLAASVGGIGFNKNHPYQLFYDNLLINANVIEHARRINVDKFVQIGTTCSYPKYCPTPFNERSIWDGYPEETNAPYGIAKRASLAQLQAAWHEYKFMGIYLIPTNLYGPFDTFDPARSHVIPALIKKFYDAIDNDNSEVTIWGSGRATRDFLYVVDAAKAIILACDNYEDPEQPINLGSGVQTSISVLTHRIQKIIEFKGQIKWNKTMPDGQPKRLLDTRKARTELGWSAQTLLINGLETTINWYKETRYG